MAREIHKKWVEDNLAWDRSERYIYSISVDSEICVAFYLREGRSLCAEVFDTSRNRSYMGTSIDIDPSNLVIEVLRAISDKKEAFWNAK